MVDNSEVIEELTELADAGDADRLLETGSRRLLAIFDTFTLRICERVVFRGVSKDLVLRCIARKNQEALEGILSLVSAGHAYVAMAVLRPMCEELIFARYIRSLPADSADKYLLNKALLELFQGLQAQAGCFPEIRRELGIETDGGTSQEGARREDLRLGVLSHKEKLKELGGKLGWGNKPCPDIKYMARITRSLQEYEFFYHAASGAVHASMHHLMRMVWGDPARGEFSITSRNFESFHRKFVLIYGSWLCSQVMDEVRHEFPREWPKEREAEYGLWLAAMVVPALRQSFPPIVTSQELRWKDSPHAPIVQP